MSHVPLDPHHDPQPVMSQGSLSNVSNCQKDVKLSKKMSNYQKDVKCQKVKHIDYGGGSQKN